jgi:hypothetical protein
VEIEEKVDRPWEVELSTKEEKKTVQILKNMDMCHNSKHSLHQNSAFIYIYMFYGEKKKTKNQFFLSPTAYNYGREREI